MKKPILSSLFPVALLALAASLPAPMLADNFTFNLGGVTIPDGNPIGFTSAQTPASNVNVITGLTVTLDIVGSPLGNGFNGDLYAYLRLDTPGGTGFTVLLNRVGTTAVPPNSFGYSDSGFNVTFSDIAANGDIHLYQNSPAYPGALDVNGALTGTWQPDGRNVDPNTVTDTSPRTTPLSSFDGLSAKGTWTLFVADLSAGGVSAINSFGLSISGISTPEFYWKGQTSRNWNDVGAGTFNWAADQAGTTTIHAKPDATSDVIFSADGAANQTFTSLGENFTIHSLTVNDTTPVLINGNEGDNVYSLTISGNAGTGITVNTGANLTINAPVTLAGLSDTIAVNGTGVATLNGVLGGTNGLIKTGGGLLTLTSANNTYTGVTTISGGILSVGTLANGGLVSDLGMSGNAATNLVFDGGTLQYTGPSVAIDRAFTINNGKTATFDVTQVATNLTLPGATGAATTGSLAKNGAGTLTLTSAGNYSGGTALNAGTLLVGDNGALGTGLLTINGGTIGSTVNPITLANAVLVNADFSTTRTGAASALIFAGAVDLGGGNRTITNLTAGNTAFSNVISNGTGFTLAATTGVPSTFQMTSVGVVNNTYTGTTTLNGPATLLLTRGAGSNAIPGDLTLNDSSQVFVQANEQIIDTSNVTLNGSSHFELSTNKVETIATLNSASAATTVALNDGRLTLNSAATATFAGTISGSAASALVKTGTGTQTLTGPNTYAGTTTVNAGTLAVDRDGITTFGTLGSGPATMNGGAGAGENGGHLYFLNSASAGGGTFTINGPTFSGAGNGTVEFFGTSTAAGGTFANSGGTVGGGIGGSTFFHDSSKAGSASVSANGSAVAGAFGGNIVFWDTSDAGGATLTATGGTGGGTGGSIFFFNSSTGGTARLIVGGNAKLDISLHSAPGVGIGSLEGSGNAFLGANSLTVGGNNLSTIFSGVIQDGGNGGGTGGSLTKTGTGTFILTGANAHTGGTTLNAGTLAAGNAKAFGSGNLTMNAGTLRTTGGPLAVDIGAGNILFNGGTYVANVGGTSPGVTHDQLKTTGMANINGGTLALVQQNGYLLAPGDKVKLVSATGGVAGGSANGTAVPGSKVTGLSAFSNTALLVPTVNLYTDSVILEVTQGSFTGLTGTLGFTANQFAVAQALDSVAARIGSKTGVFKELDFLDTQSLSTLKSNLDKISPEELTSVFQIAKSLANVQTANIERRFDEIHLDLGAVVPINSVNISVAGSQRVSKEIAPANDERWGMWFAGSGEFTHVGSTTNAAGFNLDSGGVTAGVDYRFTDKFAAGISLGYMNTTASLANNGKVDVDGGRVGAYATYFDRGFHVDASVSGGPNSYSTRRTTPNNTVATASPGGTEVNLLLATGYDWKVGSLTIGPTASFQYSNVQLDGFTETGTFAPLSVIRKNADSMRTALGVKATYDLKVGRAILRPEVRASWQHEFGDTSYSLTSTFATLGGSAFTVAGPATGRDSLLVGAGFSILLNDRLSIYAYYDGELLRTNYSSNNVSAGFRWKF